MALLIECDICGICYDYTSSDLGRIVMSLKSENRGCDNTKHYDLCPRCYDHMLGTIHAAQIISRKEHT